MDVLAHTLWTNALFHIKYATERRQRYTAVAFGVVPDLIGFTPVVIYMLVTLAPFNPGQYTEPTHWTLIYAEHAYNYTHSFVIFLASTLLVMAIRKGKLYWPMLGWGLHILIDIFTHPDFFQTPFLFPLSGFKYYGGISWAHPVFMAINYSLLILVYLIIFWYRGKRLKRMFGKHEA
ncbi:MAG: hypothetical protein IT410_04365 [Candidatus Doudnabacteria bacterium]|nr:hypothetical protein [Candidatus Doudnabacteria bacterium]